MTAEHDVLCELGNKNRAFNRPPLGECWCADRADGYVFWTFIAGASTSELSKVEAGVLPPNAGGVP